MVISTAPTLTGSRREISALELSQDDFIYSGPDGLAQAAGERTDRGRLASNTSWWNRRCSACQTSAARAFITAGGEERNEERGEVGQCSRRHSSKEQE